MLDKRVNIFQLLRQEGKLEKVLVYPAISKELDPTEHTTEKTFLNPITIEALVRNVSVEALTWKYYGNIPIGSKEIIIEKKHKTLFFAANNIQIGEDYFKTYHDDQRGFGILERMDYLVVVLERKNNA